MCYTDHSGYTAPTQQHDLHRTDREDNTCPAGAHLHHQAGIDELDDPQAVSRSSSARGVQ